MSAGPQLSCYSFLDRVAITAFYAHAATCGCTVGGYPPFAARHVPYFSSLPSCSHPKSSAGFCCLVFLAANVCEL